MVDWFGLLLFFSPWVLAPVLPLVFVPRGLRITVLALALIFALGISFVMNLGGPDSPGLALPLFGFSVAMSAVLAEGAVLAARRIRRPNSRN